MLLERSSLEVNPLKVLYAFVGPGGEAVLKPKQRGYLRRALEVLMESAAAIKSQRFTVKAAIL